MAQVGNMGILFADIAGSVRLYEAMGDEKAHRVVDACMRKISEVVAAHDGRVIKTIGDEIMAAFNDATSTCKAAIAIHRCVRDSGAHLAEGLHFKIAMRIGFQFGPAVTDNGDLFGDCVNVAARLTTLAKANQILTTVGTFELLSDDLRRSATKIGQIDVKGRAAPVAVVKVEWEEQSGGATMLQLRPETTASETNAELRLVFQRRSWVMPPDTRSTTFGRDEASDIVLNGTRSSRSHATIERRRGWFVLVDHSTNGTYVSVENKSTLKLHREELTLLRSGVIRFGAADGEDVDQALYFIG